MKNKENIITVHRNQNLFNGDLDFNKYFMFFVDGNNFTKHGHYYFNKPLDIILTKIFRKSL